jgi:Kef-type K+ transport system membrane component KefB/nucleotide-binding universal stress UspA family protein
MLQPISEHDLLLFWTQLSVLLIVARSLGLLMRRFRQPEVVGELAAGLVVGPSVFGALFPEASEWLFPGDAVTSALLLAVAWIGVALLLVVTGYETDLKLLVSLGRESAAVSTGSLVVPLGVGFAVGWAMPAIFFGEAGSQFTFAAFMAVAMSISALPVVARILGELNLMRRNIGQVTVAAAMVNDLVGWLLLGVLSGIVLGGGFDVPGMVTTVAAVLVFFGLALSLGQRGVDAALRRSLQAGPGIALPFSVSIVFVFVAAAVTQAIGVEAVIGAFVAGIVLGRSRYRNADVEHTVELASTTVFAPIFFATAGMFVDLRTLADGTIAWWAVAVIVAASFAKLAGSYVGARIGRVPTHNSLAIGIGLNARGAMEIVLATIALGLGVFNQASYTIVVLMAIVTSLLAPPLLRRALRDVSPQGEEAERLEREEVLGASVIADTDRALVPTRGGENSRLAAELLHLVLKPDAAITALTIHQPGDGELVCTCEEALEAVAGLIEGREVERRRVTSSSSEEAVLEEAGLGYGLVAVGLTEGFGENHELSATLQRLLAGTAVPLLLVRHGFSDSPHHLRGQRIVVPAVGTRAGRAAEEVASVIGARTGGLVSLVHIVSRPDRETVPVRRRVAAPGTGSPQRAAEELLDHALARALRFGAAAQTHQRVVATPHAGIRGFADETAADLIVLSSQVRAVNGRPFLGHGVEYLLEHARQTVVVVVFPADQPLPAGGTATPVA